MSIPAHSVVVSHPAKQHVYQVVLALQRAGLLRQFITGIYFKPTALPYSLVRWVPPVSQARLSKELRKRYSEELQADLIISVPYFEILSKMAWRIFLSAKVGLWSHLFVNWAHDLYVSRWLDRCHPKPAVFYGFEGSALLSFQVAKRIGIATVLDVPIIADATVILASEAKALGIETAFTRIGPRIRERLKKEVLLADRIIIPSPAVAASVAGNDVPLSKVRVLPFGVDLEQFQPATRHRQTTSNRKFCALFVGKFDFRKGVHYLLEAWKRANLKDGELIIVGPPIEPNFVANMRSQYSGSFVEAGNIPHYEVTSFYSRADIFLFPSLAEGSALVTYEALASGLPCIVTPEAGSVVRDGIEGFVVPAGDVATLKDRIMQLYRDVDLRHRMGKAARRRAEEFTWERYHNRLVDLLTELMNRRTSQANS